MFDPRIPLADVKPAAYNPRRIDDESYKLLRASLARFGAIRPILAASETGTLIAGHQRTRAMKAEGMTEAPGFRLTGVGPGDEIRFNQLHNASDVEISDFAVRVFPRPESCGFWQFLRPDQYEVGGGVKQAMKRNEILKLLQRYGPWSSVVATDSGTVIVGHLYASACKVLGMELLCRYVPDADADAIKEVFSRGYGVFDYGNLPRTTWAQSLAQMHRLRGQETGGKSRTYEQRVMPLLRPGMRVLDFGCGQGDYVKSLAESGVDITGVEFYRRVPGKLAIDVAAVNRMCDKLFASLRAWGRFDVVVCDSVINSVDSVEAERDVLTCVNAFCKPGGSIVVSGRARERQNNQENNLARKVDTGRMGVLFLDENGLSAMWNGAAWLYQKFHWQAEAVAAGREFIGDVKYKRLDDCFHLWGTKDTEPTEAAVAASLRREFSLPLPGGRAHTRGDDAVTAWASAVYSEPLPF